MNVPSLLVRVSVLASLLISGSAAGASVLHAPASQPDVQRLSKGAVDWPQTFHDAGHTGDNPAEKTLSRSNIASIQVAWGQGVAGGVTAFALNKGVIYAEGQGSGNPILDAIDAGSGALLWTAGVGNTGYGEPTVAASGSRVFTSCSAQPYYQGVCGYDAASGAQLWMYSAGCNGALPHCADVAQPVYANGVVYYGSYNAGCCHNDTVSAVDARTGQAVWAIGTGDLGSAAVAVANGLVYFGCTGSNFGGVCAVHQSDGSPAWSYNTGDANGGLTIDKGVLYDNNAGSNDAGYVTALDATTGALLWNTEYVGYLGHAFGDYPVAVAKKLVYVSGNDGTLYALRGADGTVLWSGPDSQGAPSIANGVLYLDHQGSNSPATTAHDAKTGTLLWSSPTPASTLHPPPVIANGVLYITNASCGNVCAYTLPSLRTRFAPSRLIRR